MAKWILDMHVHTKETSRCGEVAASDVVKAYVERGYNAIVTTDHMSNSTFKGIDDLLWKDRVDHFLKGNHAAKAAAPEGFAVLLGMEIRFAENDNDYLVYGFDEDFLYKNAELYRMDLESFRKLADANGLMIFQAHPFRFGMTTTEIELLDGIEVYNGHINHNSNNDVAQYWAKKYNLRPTSGSDFHEGFFAPPGGLIFDEPVTDVPTLMKHLHAQDYEVIKG